MRAPKFQMKKKTAVLVAAGVLTVGTAGGAYAYWTTTGTGSGQATTGTSTAFAVTTDALTGATTVPLTPGGPGQTIAFHVTNNNNGVQHLSSVVVTVASTASDGSSTTWNSVPGCSAGDYTVSDPTFTHGGLGDVASGATVDGTVTITMNNLASSQNGCRGATVPLYVSAS